MLDNFPIVPVYIVVQLTPKPPILIMKSPVLFLDSGPDSSWMPPACPEPGQPSKFTHNLVYNFNWETGLVSCPVFWLLRQRSISASRIHPDRKTHLIVYFALLPCEQGCSLPVGRTCFDRSLSVPSTPLFTWPTRFSSCPSSKMI